MKKIIALLLTLVVIFTLVACGNKPTETTTPEVKEDETTEETKDLLAEIQERGYIVIGTEGSWAPWTFHDEDDALVGFDIEIGTLIAEGLGVEPQFVEAEWDKLLAGLDSKRFDVICNGVGWTEERAEKYTFSDPYCFTKSVLVVASDNEEIDSFEALKDKTTANTASSTYAALAESFGATVTPVDSLQDTIELLVQHRIDATINSQVTIADYLDQHPEAPIKVVAEDNGKPVCYPVRMGEDTDSLKAAIDAVLNDLRDSGKLAEVSIKYFGIDITK